MIIFSGIRPTGDIHLGNYLGAIKQWIDLQENNDCIFCVVDLHAITTPYDVAKLQKQIFELAIDYLAVGLNPEKCILFVQSQVVEHCELAWLLGTITPMGELRRMTPAAAAGSVTFHSFALLPPLAVGRRMFLECAIRPPPAKSNHGEMDYFPSFDAFPGA